MVPMILVVKKLKLKCQDRISMQEGKTKKEHVAVVQLCRSATRMKLSFEVSVTKVGVEMLSSVILKYIIQIMILKQQ